MKYEFRVSYRAAIQLKDGIPLTFDYEVEADFWILSK